MSGLRPGVAEEIASPCVRICRLHPRLRCCEGCGRTAREIARWGEADGEERRAIRQRALDRLAGLATDPRG